MAARQGHGGAAEAVDNAPSSRKSRWHGTPGFKHQANIYECSACGHPIHDGSERLFSRQHSAPEGEFRYSCDQVQGVHLCERCYDRCAPTLRSHTALSHRPLTLLTSASAATTGALPRCDRMDWL